MAQALSLVGAAFVLAVFAAVELAEPARRRR
jgi:hypothetical protein